LATEWIFIEIDFPLSHKAPREKFIASEGISMSFSLLHKIISAN
jgi:hypothetical protein